MNNQLVTAIQTVAKKYDLYILACLFSIVWISQFSQLKHFSVYEDDIVFVVEPMKWTFQQFASSIRYLIDWPLGRPLNYLFAKDLSFIGYKVNGLAGIYFIAFLILSLNAFLFYKLVNRINSGSIAILGSIIFALYPADTTHMFITHAFGNQTAMTLVLIGFLLYSHNQKIWSYVCLLFSVLTYEPPFFLFLAAPFFAHDWNEKTLKKFLLNGAIMLFIILSVFSIRTFLGEGRVERLIEGGQLITLVHNTLANLAFGPITSLKAFVLAPVHVLGKIDQRLFLIMVLALPFVTFLIVEVKRNNVKVKQDESVNGKIAGNFERFDFKAIILGLVLILLGYVGSFSYYPAEDLLGRATRVHIAGSLGGAIIISWLICFSFNSLKSKRTSTLVWSGMVGLFLLSLVGYQYLLQNDYREAKNLQRDYWAGLIVAATDMTEGTTIFARVHGFDMNKAILGISWGDIFWLENLYKFPDEWENPPRVISILLNDERLYISQDTPAVIRFKGWPGLEFPFADENVILLDYADGEFVRHEGVYEFQGYEIKLKPIRTVEIPDWDKNVLYGIVFDN